MNKVHFKFIRIGNNILYLTYEQKLKRKRNRYIYKCSIKNIREADKVQYGIIKKFPSHSTNYLIDLV